MQAAQICEPQLQLSLHVSCSGDPGGNRPDSHAFLQDLAGRVQRATMEPLANQYLLQHLSIAVQRGNAIAIRGIMKQYDIFQAS